MTIDEKALRKIQESPGSETRTAFAGRSVLVSGLFEGSRRKADDEILASRFILETVMQINAAKDTLQRYEFLIIEEASYICQARAGEPKAKAPPVYVPQAPLNEDEAILSAITKIGLQPRLKGKRTAPSGNFIFNIEIDGSECMLMLPKDIMSREDPVASAEESARQQGIRTRSEEKEQMLERRKASRPEIAVLPIGIDKGALKRRSLTYEGESHGLHHFTYLADDIGTTLAIPDSSGKGILAELDRRIFSTHIQYMKPFIPSVIEEGTSSAKSTARIESIAQGEIKAVAKALEVMVKGTEIDASLVPAEYIEAWKRVKESDQFAEYSLLCGRGVLTKDEAAAFHESYEKIAHPADGIVKAWLRLHMGPDGTLEEAKAEELRGILRRAQEYPLGVCERALRNIAEAYSEITGDKAPLEWDAARIESKYLEMTLRIRKSMADSLPTEMQKLVD